MICCSTRLTDSSSAHSVYDSLILDENLKCIIDGIVILCKCRCKCFCLRNCSWKSVKNISIFAIILFEAVYNKVTYKFIRYKISCIHILFSFLSKLRTVFDIFSKNISCRNSRNTKFFSNLLCVCSFTCSRCT